MIAVNIPTMEQAELTREQCADMLGIPHERCLGSLIEWLPNEEKPFVFFLTSEGASKFTQTYSK